MEDCGEFEREKEERQQSSDYEGEAKHNGNVDAGILTKPNYL